MKNQNKTIAPNKMRSPICAPKNGEIILADFKKPELSFASWDEDKKMWLVTTFDEIKNESTSEFKKNKHLQGWIPWPKEPNETKIQLRNCSSNHIDRYKYINNNCNTL